MCIIDRGDGVMSDLADYKKTERRDRVKKTAFNVFKYLMLGIWGVIVLFPFYWMVLTSIKSYSAYNS